jgi:hypothetical protein
MFGTLQTFVERHWGPLQAVVERCLERYNPFSSDVEDRYKPLCCWAVLRTVLQTDVERCLKHHKALLSNVKLLLRDVKEPLQTERHKQLTRRDSCHVPSLICNKALKKIFFFWQFRIFVRSAVRTIKKLSSSDVERLLQERTVPSCRAV